MRHKKTKANYRRIVLRLPDLDHTKTAVLNSLTSPASRRVYQYAIEKFIAWYCSEPRLAFNRIVVVRYRIYLESCCLALTRSTSTSPRGVIRDPQGRSVSHHQGIIRDASRCDSPHTGEATPLYV